MWRGEIHAPSRFGYQLLLIVIDRHPRDRLFEAMQQVCPFDDRLKNTEF